MHMFKMLDRLYDRLWHRWLGNPYYLAKFIDQGQGQTVILLHGIGRPSRDYGTVIKLLLDARHYRVVAYDLLGFNFSPQPRWIKYDIDDHANAVINSIERLRPGHKVIIVGHSMGALIATRVGRLRPDLVRHLVLYQMPVYTGLAQKWRYRLQTNVLYRFYRWIVGHQPNYKDLNRHLVDRYGQRLLGMEVTKQNWLPFTRSLENTIMQQTTAEDIRHLEMKSDIIYGRFDTLVIQPKPDEFLGHNQKNIKIHTIKARHEISDIGATKIAECIIKATEVPVKKQRKTKDVVA